MKYIISESKISDIFSKYMETAHPEFNRLSINRSMSEFDEGYTMKFFEKGRNTNTLFTYAVDNTDEESFPMLVVHVSRFPDDVKKMFGNRYLKLFKEWFENEYNLPNVKNVYERI